MPVIDIDCPCGKELRVIISWEANGSVVVQEVEEVGSL